MKTTTSFSKIARINTPVRVIQGGTSAGKTYSILQLLIYIAYRSKKNLVISIVSESLPHLKRGAMRDFFKILLEEGLYDVSCHNKTDSTYKIGKCVIEFFSVDQESKVRGARRDILFVNEANNISEETYNQLEVRTNRFVFLDYNPTTEFWVHTEVMKHDDSEMIILTYKDNEYLEEKIVKSIEKRKPVYDKDGNLIRGNENWWKVYGEGQTGILEGLIFKNFEVIPSLPKEATLIGYGQDFGFSSDPAALVGVYKYNGSLVVDEIFYETELTNADLVKKYQEHGIRKYDPIWADSAEPKSIEEIHRSGYNIKPVHKGPDSIKFGIDLMQQYKIFITQSSVNIIKEFRNYTWDKDRNGKSLNRPIDFLNHSCFSGDTKITTISGEKNIKDIDSGDFVLTRKGFCKVIKRHNNGVKQTRKYCLQLDTFSLEFECTDDHLIFTNFGWIEISKLRSGMMVCLYSFSWEGNIRCTQKKDTFPVDQKECTKLFLSTFMEKLKKVFMFIIKTAIVGIIKLITWRKLKVKNIFQNIVKKDGKKTQKNSENFSKKELLQQKNGTEAKRERNGTKSTLKKYQEKYCSLINSKKNVKFARRDIQFISQIFLGQDFARTHASQNTEGIQELITKSENVNCAKKNIHVVNTENSHFALVNVQEITGGEERIKEVYDLEVEGEHEYFANGILFHNCDAIRYCCMMALGKEIGEVKRAENVQRPIMSGLMGRNF